MEAHSSTKIRNTKFGVLRMIDALRLGTEVGAIESTEETVVELIPGPQNMRQRSLPHMHFEARSVIRGMYGRVSPLLASAVGATT